MPWRLPQLALAPAVPPALVLSACPRWFLYTLLGTAARSTLPRRQVLSLQEVQLLPRGRYERAVPKLRQEPLLEVEAVESALCAEFVPLAVAPPEAEVVEESA